MPETNEKPPMQRIRGITIKSTNDGVPFSMEPDGDREVKLVPQETQGEADGPAGPRTLSIQSLNLNLRRGEYYFPKPRDRDTYGKVVNELNDNE